MTCRLALLRFFLALLVGSGLAAYGAAAKGVTMVNYCGVRADLLPYVADLSEHKQDHYMPGSRIPVYPPERLEETRPDYVLILAWNLKDEIMRQLAEVGTSIADSAYSPQGREARQLLDEAETRILEIGESGGRSSESSSSAQSRPATGR